MAGVYKKLDGVAKDPAPKVDFEKKTLTLSYDPKKLDEKKLIAALAETRFKAKAIAPETDKKKDADK